MSNASSEPTIFKKMMTSIKRSDIKGEEVQIINQLLLPHVIEWEPVRTIEDAFDAIKEMKIRGAPAIASLAALTISLVVRERMASPQSDASSASSTETAYPVPALDSATNFIDWTATVCDYLQTSRPTAVNLSEGMNRIRAVLKGASAASQSGSSHSALQIAQKVVDTCEAIHAEDLQRNIEMSKNGADWVWSVTQERRKKEGKEPKKGLKIMTVCNTGSLATSGYGTALGVITNLFETGRLEKAFYTQSTPYHQGSRLTSLELSTLEIPSCMICDTMVGSLFQHQDIDGVVVGADRVVRNGDTANKIGTYQAASLAKMHGIPFMVIAPVTTLDLNMSTGKEIHIEQRPAVEAIMARGLNPETGKQSVVQITPDGIGRGGQPWQDVYNPSFDVTPARLISCVVTEKGVAVNGDSSEAIDLSAAV